MKNKTENNPQTANSDLDAVSTRFICDCCDEEWEIEFMCEKCSNRMEAITDECGFEVDYARADVCGNCCDCHLRSK